MNNSSDRPWLLAVQETPGYNYRPLYEQAGFQVAIEYSVRRALARLKTLAPQVIVADFGKRYFHDRVSNLESLLAARTRFPSARVLILYNPSHQSDLARLLVRCPADATLPLPAEDAALVRLLAGWAGTPSVARATLQYLNP